MHVTAAVSGQAREARLYGVKAVGLERMTLQGTMMLLMGMKITRLVCC